MQLLGKVISAGTTLLITIFLARTYKASGYGEFTTMTTFVSIFYLLVDFGMNAAFLKKIHEGQIDKKTWFSSLFFLRVVLSGILMFGALSILAFLPYHKETGEGFSSIVKLGIIVLIPTILTQALITTFNAVFQNELQYDKASLALLAGSFVTLGMVLGLGAVGTPMPILVSSFFVGGVVTATVSYIVSKRFVPLAFSWHSIQQKELRLLFMLSLPLGISLVFNTIHFRADVFVLTLTRSSADVGIYGLASKFFEFPLTIPTFFMNAVYPLLLSAIQVKDAARWKRMIKESLVFLGVSSIVVSGVGIAAAPFLVSIHQDFAASIVPFRILMGTLPLFFLSSLLNWVVVSSGRPWNLVWIYAGAMVVNIILNILFIPSFGPPAAAITTGVSEGIILILLGWNTYRTRSVFSKI